MTSIDLIGYVAATLTTGSFVPQAWHTFRTRDVSGISLGMYSAFTLGVAVNVPLGWWLSTVVFAEHWIFPRLGWTQFWASRKGLVVSWPAGGTSITDVPAGTQGPLRVEFPGR